MRVMKNSFFVSLLCIIGRFIIKVYNGSFVKRVVDAVYNFFSRRWSESIIVHFISRDCDCSASKSFFVRMLSGIKGLYIRFGAWLKKVISNSAVYNVLCSYSKSLLAFNTRFFGMMLCSSVVSYSIIVMVSGSRVSFAGISVLIVGVICGIFNINIFNLFHNSAIVSSVCRFFCCELKEREEFKTNGYSLIGALVVGLFAGLILNESILLYVLAIAAFSGVVLILVYPVIGVFAAVFVAPLVPTMVLVALVILVFSSYIIHVICSGKYPVKIKNISVALAIFVFINFVSAFVSFSPLNSLQILAVSISMMLIYFVICGTVTNKKLLTVLLKVFFISGTIVAAYGIMQYVFKWGLDVKNAWIDKDMFAEATVRVYSTLENPNVLGEYLLLASIPCLAFVFHSDRWYSKLFYAAMFLVMAVCLVLTQSRGCWIGFLIAVAVYVTFMKGRIWGLVPLIVLALPFVLPQSVTERFGSIGDLGDSSSSYRMFIWLGTIEMLKDFWFFGVGQGQKAFNIVYPSYSYSAIIAPHAHNLYLQIFAECGFAALVSFLSVCVFWFKKVIASFRENLGKSMFMRSLSISIGAGMLAYLVQGMFDYVFYNYRVMMIFWAVIGIGMALHNVSEGSYD